MNTLEVARLVRSADFERVLRARACARSAHFALHHLGVWPSDPRKPRAGSGDGKLSTDAVHGFPGPVDDSQPRASSAVTESSRRTPIFGVTLAFSPPLPWVPAAPGSLWLGAVVPKRHARRSVTRSALKRQIRAVFSDQRGKLAGGLWVVRLRAPFDRQVFVSATSEALEQAAREELAQLLISASRREPRLDSVPLE